MLLSLSPWSFSLKTLFCQNTPSWLKVVGGGGGGGQYTGQGYTSGFKSGHMEVGGNWENRLPLCAPQT